MPATASPPVAAQRHHVRASGDPVVRAVQDYLSHLGVERGLAANTVVSYRRDLRRYATFLHDRGRHDVTAITPADVTAFLAGLREGSPEHPPLGAGSAARTLAAVRGLHKFLLREGTVTSDAAAEVKPPSAPKRLPKALSVQQVQDILDAAAAPGTTLAARDRALLELLYSTGARISEVVGLDVDDVDLDASAVLLRGKGSRQRVVPFGSYADSALRDYLAGARAELVRAGAGQAAVFVNSRGGRLSRQSAWTVLVRAADRAGIEADVSPHTLRHSFATHLLDGGADVRVVQELLGHASVTTTQIYTLVTIDHLREVYATAHPRARA